MDSPRFLADAMLGKTASKLRILGYDTAYHSSANLQQATSYAAITGRILITRNRRARTSHAIIVPPQGSESDTMSCIVRAANLDVQISAETARCAICNGVTHKTSPQAVRGLIPPNTGRHFTRFWKCENCERIYWEGSHIKRMQKEAESWNM